MANLFLFCCLLLFWLNFLVKGVIKIKYAILLNSEVTEEHDNLVKAEQAYKEYVKEEGDTFDFSLVATLETHEAPAKENSNDYFIGRHFNVDYSKNKRSKMKRFLNRW